MDRKNLNAKELNFCTRVAANEKPAEAYSIAFKKQNLNYCRSSAKKLLDRENIQNKIREIRTEVIKKTEIKIEEIALYLYRMATADVNEIVQYRRVPCRYCYGKNFNFQWVNEIEFLMALEKNENLKNSGGYGFNRQLPPNSNCPMCRGEGKGETHVNDTRFLSEGARHLYNGVKFKKDGTFEVKLRDRDKHLEMLAKFCYITGVTEIGDSEKMKMPDLSNKDPNEAVRIYQNFM